MTIKLKKAENLIEAYQVFETQIPLMPDQCEFYIEIYQDDIKELRKSLILNIMPHRSFFVTGQAGNGKTTALNFLPDDAINKKYDVKYLKGRELFNLDDIDIIDVILMIGFTVVDGHKELEDKYLNILEEMKKLKVGKLTKGEEGYSAKKKEGGGKTSFAAKFPFFSWLKIETGFFARYKIEREKREFMREIFTPDMQELIEKINEIIASYNENFLKSEKLLIIIDDLEKIRDQQQAYNLFVNNHYVFNEIQSTKIVTFPAHLADDHPMYLEASKFGIRIAENPHEETENGEVQKNREKLKNVIWQRLVKRELVREDAADMAVEFSGGNLRFLVGIMQKAVLDAINLEDEETHTQSIMPANVKKAVENMAALPSLSVMSRLKVLTHVMEKKCKPEGEELMKDFNRSILDNTIFAYFNGKPWYDLNPIIRDSVKVYSRKREE
ncbi:MAG: hypothetical protein GY749_45975 [Desulfobacteraceae bacterium]|nr:hypothetical protein [Desulfobacteraceae bacterium]